MRELASAKVVWRILRHFLDFGLGAEKLPLNRPYKKSSGHMAVKVVDSSLDKVKGSQGGNRRADITRSLFIETKKKS